MGLENATVFLAQGNSFIFLRNIQLQASSPNSTQDMGGVVKVQNDLRPWKIFRE
jgi:hypothetical protein